MLVVDSQLFSLSSLSPLSRMLLMLWSSSLPQLLLLLLLLILGLLLLLLFGVAASANDVAKQQINFNTFFFKKV